MQRSATLFEEKRTHEHDTLDQIAASWIDTPKGTDLNGRRIWQARAIEPMVPKAQCSFPLSGMYDSQQGARRRDRSGEIATPLPPPRRPSRAPTTGDPSEGPHRPLALKTFRLLRSDPRGRRCPMLSPPGGPVETPRPRHPHPHTHSGAIWLQSLRPDAGSHS